MERGSDDWARDPDGRILLPLTNGEKKMRIVLDILRWGAIAFLVLGYLYGC